MGRFAVQPSIPNLSLVRVSAATPVELYDFQKQVIDEIYGHIRNNVQRILTIAPCGSGKTTIASWIIRNETQQFRRCLFLVSLNCLLDQAAESLTELGVSCSVLQGDRDFDPSSSAIVASIQTIHSRIKNQSIDDVLGDLGIVFADEVHNLAYSSTYEIIQNHYLPTGTTFIGLTATPYRTKNTEWLGQWFDTAVLAPQPPELVTKKLLVPCRKYGFGQTFDFSKLDTGWDGDYSLGQVEDQATSRAALDCVVREWKRLAENRLTAAFCATVIHAEMLSEAFNNSGIPSEWISGNTSYGDRAAMFERLDRGQTLVLCSVGVLTAGWNQRSVSCIIYDLPTKSKAKFFQASGRAGRTYPGKTHYLLLDFGNNIAVHGDPMGRQNYDIGPKYVKEKTITSLKECPHCHSMISTFLRICPYCEFEFERPEPVPKEDKIIDAELVELLSTDDKEKARFLRLQKRECFKKLIDPKVATKAFIEKYGYVPPDLWHFQAVLGKRYSNQRRVDYENYLRLFARHDFGFKCQMRLEFGTEEKFSKPGIDFSFNWWSVLEVDKNCDGSAGSLRDLRSLAKEAYRRLATIYHPDTSGDPNAHTRMTEINDAWDKAIAHFEKYENN